MALRSELKELLSDFEKRMKFIHIVRCLLDYRYPDAIQSMIPDRKILDNVIVAVLVYIKDRTLGTEQTCTLRDIERFLEDFSVVLPNPEQIDTGVLARYIVVDVLQNGGILTEFLTFHSKTETFEMMPVRLLNEAKGSYHLTDDAFDFLFRSKEIESELDYSVTRFRMKEYMRRDNYADALDASRELVSRIRNMKISMDDFLLRCRENIAKITIDQYETVVSRIRSLLESEYKELTEIQDEARNREKTLEEAQRSGVGGSEMQKNRAALREMIQNVTLTIEEQRILINKKTSLAESYESLIRDNFTVNQYQRLNFEKDILSPLRQMGDQLGDAAKFLLFVLEKPTFAKQFSVESFYAPQGKLNNQEAEPGIDLTAEETDQQQVAEVRNRRNRKVIQNFFEFAQGKERFSVSEFVGDFRMAELVEACEENTLPNIMLTLFSMQELDLEGWKKDEHFTVLPNGEFELSWCLEEIPQELLDSKQIRFHKLDHTFGFTAVLDGQQRKIAMTDFEVEVIR